MKILLIVLAGKESHESMGRVTNALVTARELKDEHEVKLIFDGAGTQWIADLYDPDHKMHELFHGLEDNVVAVCAYCAEAFDAQDIPEELMEAENIGHPSMSIYMDHKIITY